MPHKQFPSHREELRDKFAIAAMQGILSNSAMIDTATDQTIEWVAKNAYQMADAMLKARG
ncbi:hypothetical protein GKR75_16020 [Providencia sp. wls1919]|nr:hypothetical protein [Providencia sp. wls1919]